MAVARRSPRSAFSTRAAPSPRSSRRCSDPVPDVRASAAWALGMLRDDQAVEPLMKALKDSEGSVRVAAADALAVLLGNAKSHADRGLRMPRVRVSPNPNPRPNPRPNPNPNPNLPNPNPNPNPNPRPRPEFTWAAGGWR